MKTLRRITVVTLAIFGLTAGLAAADNKGNDRVLTGTKNEFIEVFKRDEEGGDKNYEYTITEFTDKHGRACTTVTGDSEKTIALDCDWKPKG